MSDCKRLFQFFWAAQKHLYLLSCPHNTCVGRCVSGTQQYTECQPHQWLTGHGMMVVLMTGDRVTCTWHGCITCTRWNTNKKGLSCTYTHRHPAVHATPECRSKKVKHVQLDSSFCQCSVLTPSLAFPRSPTIWSNRAKVYIESTYNQCPEDNKQPGAALR